MTVGRKLLVGAIAMSGLLAAAPAFADVKAGVDAWAKGDFPRAVAEWRPLAIAGDADAQFNLAQAYKLGRGVPLDPALAESWFRKAALQGHLQAGDNYGLALFQANKKSDALPWLEKSVARGEPRAQLVLGTMLFNGDGVPRDFPRAYALMTRASASGLQSASQTLTQMDQYISPADREKGTALAQQYALQARPAAPSRATVGQPADAAGQRVATRPGISAGGQVEIPPSRIAETPRPTRMPPSSLPARVPGPTREPMPTSPRLTTAKSAPAKAVAAKSTPKPEAKPAPARPTGNWRVQLGAFRDQGNAETLWSRVRGKLRGAQPFYPKAGGVTRLQAGGFASKADATRACSAAGVPCVIVAP
ncbi:SPOR domain-containing protein [Sphingomonas sp. Leaf38]|uniref:SPOR domain-containing protein n=1 Tax=Sphingomonas sp. Leaf38 TaxID=1736217 RepID=UPI0006F20039|nr:SPOR domain-containing protein [Sphingomonas sp. Leaf38]KQN29461.1 sporulation protein [Sphingomonas sp. Leaf38]